MHRLIFLLATLIALLPIPARAQVIPGLEVLITDQLALTKGKRVGLVTNQTGVDRKGRSNIDLLRKRGVNLVALYSPEHGIRGAAQAGEKVASSNDRASGLPIHSLYGATKEPTPAMLRGVDLLIFDMQDVGARFYTYPYTMLAVMRAAEKHRIPLLILDRPNPLGGEVVEGPVLTPPNASFIGMFEMPVRHGMTMGELATMFRDAYRMKLDLKVLRMKGWKRAMDWRATGLRWTPPSPNMPTPDTARVYPGTALFEGTNISEGRGTARPFEQIGAPFIDGAVLARALNAAGLPGVRFSAVRFTPSASKFAGQECGGVTLTVTDPMAFRPFHTGVAMVKAVHDLYPAEFAFRAGAPSFFDQLAGVDGVRTGIIAGDSVAVIEARWQAGLDAFMPRRKAALLY